MNNQDLAAVIAAAFLPGMADAVRLAEAEERVRLQARLIGADPDAIIDRAKFRYVQSPRSGTDALIEMMEDVLRETLTSGV